MSGHDDFAVEPIRGLPQLPPAGEQILWQGGPDGRQLLRHLFHARWVAGYFLALMGFNAVQQLRAGHGLAAAALSALAPLPLALLGLGLLALLARLIARTSVYTLTSRRLVLRIGVALPIAFNIPFGQLARADLRLRPDGSGDIPLTLMPGQRLGFVALWPHVRPWRLNQPQPMMRGLADAAGVAELLCRAVGQPVPDLRPVPVSKGTVQYT